MQGCTDIINPIVETMGRKYPDVDFSPILKKAAATTTTMCDPLHVWLLNWQECFDALSESKMKIKKALYELLEHTMEVVQKYPRLQEMEEYAQLDEFLKIGDALVRKEIPNRQKELERSIATGDAIQCKTQVDRVRLFIRSIIQFRQNLQHIVANMQEFQRQKKQTKQQFTSKMYINTQIEADDKKDYEDYEDDDEDDDDNYSDLSHERTTWGHSYVGDDE